MKLDTDVFLIMLAVYDYDSVATEFCVLILYTTTLL